MYEIKRSKLNKFEKLNTITWLWAGNLLFFPMVGQKSFTTLQTKQNVEKAQF